MKLYKIKKLVSGYRVSPLLKNKTLIAIPYTNNYEPIQAFYNNKSMIINNKTPLLQQKTFPDKFGRNTNYTLFYYEWLPNDNQQKLF